MELTPALAARGGMDFVNVPELWRSGISHVTRYAAAAHGMNEEDVQVRTGRSSVKKLVVPCSL